MKRKYIVFAAAVILCMAGLSACSSAEPQVMLREGSLEEQAAPTQDGTADYASESEKGEVFSEADDVNGSRGQDEESNEQGNLQEDIYLHICGAVWQPGVYALPAGSRLCDAVEAAGGFLPTACRDYCNLALVVRDGMQYQIPTTEEVLYGELPEAVQAAAGQPADDGTTAGSSGTDLRSSYDGSGLLNINLATAAELMTLPGIGQTRAEAIITYREEHGAFADIRDIMNVSGIKDATFANIQEYITAR